jgi:hypothetical protein
VLPRASARPWLRSGFAGVPPGRGGSARIRRIEDRVERFDAVSLVPPNDPPHRLLRSSWHGSGTRVGSPLRAAVFVRS